MTKRSAPEPAAPHGFRRNVSVAKVGEGGLAQTVTASPAELPKIASYLGLVGIRALKGEVNFARWRGKEIRVSGKLKADVTQSCVVTLDPVDAHVEGEFERRFLPDVEEQGTDVFVDPEGDDPPEPLGRDIDLGEILVEELALNLDPYPRKPGVAFETAQEASPPTARENPFAALAKLKPKPEKKV